MDGKEFAKIKRKQYRAENKEKLSLKDKERYQKRKDDFKKYYQKRKKAEMLRLITKKTKRL